MLEMEVKVSTYQCDHCKDKKCTSCDDYHWAKPLVDHDKKQDTVQKLKELLGPRMFEQVFTYLKWDMEGAETVELPVEVYLHARRCLREILKWMEEVL